MTVQSKVSSLGSLVAIWQYAYLAMFSLLFLLQLTLFGFIWFLLVSRTKSVESPFLSRSKNFLNYQVIREMVRGIRGTSKFHSSHALMSSSQYSSIHNKDGTHTANYHGRRTKRSNAKKLSGVRYPRTAPARKTNDTLVAQENKDCVLERKYSNKTDSSGVFSSGHGEPAKSTDAHTQSTKPMPPRYPRLDPLSRDLASKSNFSKTVALIVDSIAPGVVEEIENSVAQKEDQLRRPTDNKAKVKIHAQPINQISRDPVEIKRKSKKSIWKVFGNQWSLGRIVVLINFIATALRVLWFLDPRPEVHWIANLYINPIRILLLKIPQLLWLTAATVICLVWWVLVIKSNPSPLHSLFLLVFSLFLNSSCFYLNSRRDIVLKAVKLKTTNMRIIRTVTVCIICEGIILLPFNIIAAFQRDSYFFNMLSHFFTSLITIIICGGMLYYFNKLSKTMKVWIEFFWLPHTSSFDFSFLNCFWYYYCESIM